MDNKEIENKETVLKKTQTAEILTKKGGKYSYQYVDIAQIHDYLAQNGMKYYQEIETSPINGEDYIQTYRYINDKWEDKPKRGCRVVNAELMGNDNPAQKQGSALTYARRYSLLMAFGLATEDDDATSLSKPKKSSEEITTQEQAGNYKINFGKYAGKTIKELLQIDKEYCKWLLEKGDETVKKCLSFYVKKGDNKNE